MGLKENVIVGHLIPAGTGLREYGSIIVGSKEEYDALVASKEAFTASNSKKEKGELQEK
jgi:DNA-directed RNA polymerase subunit beta'